MLTGLGLVTPLGLNAAETWDGVRAGKSGISPIQSFDASPLPVRFGGEIRNFDAKTFIDKKDRKQIKVMARGIQLAVAAAQMALDDGQVDKTKLDPTRFGIEFGSGLLATELKELADAAKTSSPAAKDPWKVDLDKWGSRRPWSDRAAVDAEVSAEFSGQPHFHLAQRSGPQQQHHPE